MGTGVGWLIGWLNVRQAKENVRCTEKDTKNITSIDKGKKLFNCEFCSKSFKTKQTCNIHVSSECPGRYSKEVWFAPLV